MEIFLKVNSKTILKDLKQKSKKYIKAAVQSEKLYNCNICAAKFLTQTKLDIHLKVVHGGRKYCRCDSCGKSFSTAGNLKKRIQSVHESQENHKCDCGKFFFSSRQLEETYKLSS